MRICPVLRSYGRSCGSLRRPAGLAGGGITLKFKTAAFRTITRARRLDRPTQSAEEMFRAAVPLLAGEANGRAFRLIGIGAHDLVGAREVAIGGPPAGSGYAACSSFAA